MRWDVQAFEVMAGLAEFWFDNLVWKAAGTLSPLRVEETKELGAFESWMSPYLKCVFTVDRWKNLDIDLLAGSEHVHVRSDAGSVSAGVDWLFR